MKITEADINHNLAVIVKETSQLVWEWSDSEMKPNETYIKALAYINGAAEMAERLKEVLKNDER